MLILLDGPPQGVSYTRQRGSCSEAVVTMSSASRATAPQPPKAREPHPPRRSHTHSPAEPARALAATAQPLPRPNADSHPAAAQPGHTPSPLLTAPTSPAHGPEAKERHRGLPARPTTTRPARRGPATASPPPPSRPPKPLPQQGTRAGPPSTAAPPQRSLSLPGSKRCLKTNDPTPAPSAGPRPSRQPPPRRLTLLPLLRAQPARPNSHSPASPWQLPPQ